MDRKPFTGWSKCRDIATGEPDWPRLTSSTGPSRSNRSFNDEFMALHFLHGDFRQISEPMRSKIVHRNVLALDMEAAKIECVPDHLRLSHHRNHTIRRLNFDRAYGMRCGFIHKMKGNILLRPYLFRRPMTD